MQADLDDLNERLARTRWPDQLPGVGWSYGVNRDYLQELVEYWRTGYSFREHAARLNRLPRFTTTISPHRCRPAWPTSPATARSAAWPSCPTRSRTGRSTTGAATSPPCRPLTCWSPTSIPSSEPCAEKGRATTPVREWWPGRRSLTLDHFWGPAAGKDRG
ncbi:hypothetical protein DP939_04250 [Spongiactinospora rosea]|uniref:Epoxide hydrolase N-terminal domain-containing protein n=1 Tax=Spongiactinospora rosea TaxID=2248750 RepID=A0A366M8U6_9ACTN|nr:hypothetical protein DP939_04250 [Spongiactinospora rosea]